MNNNKKINNNNNDEKIINNINKNNFEAIRTKVKMIKRCKKKIDFVQNFPLNIKKIMFWI